MMLALDLIQGVAQRIQEILVGVDDVAVESEFDDGLGAVQRRDHAGVHAGIGDIVPFQNIADIIALGVEHAADAEREFEIAHGDVGPMGQPARIGQQLPLMRGIFVEGVDTGADDPVRSKFGQIARKAA